MDFFELLGFLLVVFLVDFDGAVGPFELVFEGDELFPCLAELPLVGFLVVVVDKDEVSSSNPNRLFPPPVTGWSFFHMTNLLGLSSGQKTERLTFLPLSASTYSEW